MCFTWSSDHLPLNIFGRGGGECNNSIERRKSDLAEETVRVDLQQLPAGVPVPQADSQLVRQGLAQRRLSGAGGAVKQNHPVRTHRWTEKGERGASGAAKGRNGASRGTSAQSNEFEQHNTRRRVPNCYYLCPTDGCLYRSTTFPYTTMC